MVSLHIDRSNCIFRLIPRRVREVRWRFTLGGRLGAAARRAALTVGKLSVGKPSVGKPSVDKLRITARILWTPWGYRVDDRKTAGEHSR